MSSVKQPAGGGPSIDGARPDQPGTSALSWVGQHKRLVDVIYRSDGGLSGLQRVSVDQELVIGRGDQCHVRLPSDLVSRAHVILTLGGDSLEVRDVSSNGTLAGTIVLRKRAVEVPYGTPIGIGDYTVFVQPVSSGDSTAALKKTPRTAPNPSRSAASGAPILDDQQGVAPTGVESAGPATIGGPVPESGPVVSRAIRREIHRQLLDYLDLSKLDAAKLEDPSMRPKVLLALRRIIGNLGAKIQDGVNRDILLGELADEALGLGPLENFLADPAIDEIMVVDANTIYAETGGQLIKTNASFTDDERVRAVIERIVTPLGRRIDESSPLVDARLRDGSRVNAIIRPLAVKGSCVTIRKFARAPLTMENLMALRALDERMARFLRRSVLARKNIVISGGTGSGKTTLLNVLSAAIPPGERIITIEDAAELRLEQPHVVSLETRPANMEGKGQYTIRDLVKNALRMRPDRIIVGECRGGEALDMLQAMNTGHDGSLTTTHANSTQEALARLETLALMSGVELPARAIREQIATSIDLIVQQSRYSDGTRRVSEISEVVGLGDDGEFEVRTLFRFVRSGRGPQGEVLGDYRATGYLPSFLDQFIVMGLVEKGEAYL
jgi:pilus assembly protein CpaF